METTVPADMELLRVGDWACAFRPGNHATALLNGMAGRVVLDLKQGRDPRGIAEEIARESAVGVEQVLSDIADVCAGLVRSGLIGPDYAPAMAAPLSHPGGAPTGIRLGPFAIAGGRPVAIEIEDRSLADLLAAVLAPLRCAGEPQAGIRVVSDGAGHDVWSGGERVVRGADRSLARRAVLQTALVQMLGGGTIGAILHASSVAIGGRGVVLSGATGSGKTTLMLALVAAGARYLSDDFTPLHRVGGRISPFPVAASVKSGSWGLVSDRFARLRGASVHALGGREVRYLEIGGEAGADTVPVGALVFPRYVAGAALRLERLAPEDVLRRLVEGGSAPFGDEPSMRPIVDLVCAVPGWTLSYSDLDAAVATAMQLGAGA